MGNYFVSTHPVRVTDDDGEHWVDIKEALTLADRGRYTDAIMGVGADLGGQASMQFRLGQVNQVLLECAILGWNLPDPDTKKELDVSPRNISRINWEAPLFRKVLEEIKRRNPTLSDLSESSGSES